MQDLQELVSNGNFNPEYIEADEVIQVDGEYYGIFNVSGPEYSLPLVVFIDSVNYFTNGQPPAGIQSFTKEEWENANERLFVPVLNYSQLQDPDDRDLGRYRNNIRKILHKKLLLLKQVTGYLKMIL